MQKIVNVATWWRHFGGQSIKISAAKMAPPGGDIKFLFHRSKSKVPTLSHAKQKFRDIFIQKKVAKFLR